MGKTFRSSFASAHVAMRHPKGSRRAKSFGDRSIPPSEYDDIQPGDEVFRPWRVAHKMLDDGLDPEIVKKRLSKRFHLEEKHATHIVDRCMTRSTLKMVGADMDSLFCSCAKDTVEKDTKRKSKSRIERPYRVMTKMLSMRKGGKPVVWCRHRCKTLGDAKRYIDKMSRSWEGSHAWVTHKNEVVYEKGTVKDE